LRQTGVAAFGRRVGAGPGVSNARARSGLVSGDALAVLMLAGRRIPNAIIRPTQTYVEYRLMIRSI